MGVGMGGLMQTSMLIAQNSVEQRDLGVASGAATFFRSIGGSFGIALFGAIFAGRLHESLVDRLGQTAADQYASGGAGAVASPAAIQALPPPIPRWRTRRSRSRGPH